jgi:hypothetical protein
MQVIRKMIHTRKRKTNLIYLIYVCILPIFSSKGVGGGAKIMQGIFGRCFRDDFGPEIGMLFINLK